MSNNRISGSLPADLGISGTFTKLILYNNKYSQYCTPPQSSVTVWLAHSSMSNFSMKSAPGHIEVCLMHVVWEKFDPTRTCTG
eukprot:SM000002S05507  [mRNA]  locus=s2:220325:220703:- [translate_table: standard]